MAWMNLIYLLITTTLLYTKADRAYDYLMFVQQWGPTFCATSQCYKVPTPTFTVHGIWPSNYSLPRLDCNGYGAGYNKIEMDNNHKLKNKLIMRSWPNLRNGDHNWLWEHEWENHGQCSENVLPQTKYFERGHDMWLELDIDYFLSSNSIVPGGVYSYIDIEYAIVSFIKLLPLLRCWTRNNMLLEVVICYDHSGNNIIDCDTSTSNCQPGKPISFPN